ncbi:MAG: tRNA pseudouridine(54/55) synthase Pus10 [Candidatus Thermoplasmatota archaeon]|jgi:tRNA pseudouridine synthase 10|nr:tRNA pseudouridine(54/55) synthase Pus10 [Candidatus Thermoplasmatota archaeon]
MTEFDLEKINEFAPFCLSCLGRSVGLVGFGLDNRERGLEMANLIEISSGIDTDKELICDSEDCKICDGLIGEIDNFIDLSCDSILDYSLETFKIGTIVDKDILDTESEFSKIFGLNLSETIKSQLNREIGIGVFQNLDISARLDRPDSTIIIDTRYDTINLEIKSIFIEGKYNKYDRTIPQTHWPCSKCKGRGCRLCNNTGQLYPDSVQSLVAAPFMKATHSTENLFHGMGREDIDAAMLGSGRPFVLELRRPKVRDIDLDKMQMEINTVNKDRIRVSNFKLVSRSRVAELKNTVCDKSYRVEVSVPEELSIESLKNGAQRLKEKLVKQRTPTRVAHRRADLIRPRFVESVKVLSFEQGMVELEIKAQHGTYIRELVSGDMGRTVPSFSSLVDGACKVEVLDVLNLHLENEEETK